MYSNSWRDLIHQKGYTLPESLQDSLDALESILPMEDLSLTKESRKDIHFLCWMDEAILAGYITGKQCREVYKQIKLENLI